MRLNLGYLEHSPSDLCTTNISQWMPGLPWLSARDSSAVASVPALARLDT